MAPHRSSLPEHAIMRRSPAMLLMAAGIAVLYGATPAHATRSAGSCGGDGFDPFRLYGNQAAYTVLRNGDAVGSHIVTFERRDQSLIVDTRFEITIDVLFFTAYRYLYTSTETWQGGCLAAIDVAIDDNGETSTIAARQEGGTLKVDGPAGRVTAQLGLFPTNHWNAGVLNQGQVLNTLTGGVNDVRIIARGLEERPVNGEVRSVRSYAYTGDLSNEVWYDAQGRWVGMRFLGSDGSTIEHVCKTCARDLSALQ
jgi:hypothetical protein